MDRQESPSLPSCTWTQNCDQEVVLLLLFETVISRNVKLSKYIRTLVLMPHVEAGCWTLQADSSGLS